MSAPALLEVDDLVVRFRGAGRGFFGFGGSTVHAVNGVSLTLRRGETLGLVGESGSGKSSLGRAILRLGEISDGRIVFEGTDVVQASAAELAKLRLETALIFQDPYGALNPRMTIGAAIAEVLRVHRKAPPGGVEARVRELLRMVGLAPELASRRPAALSGGQCQRAGIARALAVEPKLIVADECVASLDVSIQGQIINLLMDLKERMNLALIFIAHDLAVVRRICDRVAVMYLGRIVEEGPTEAVFRAPRHPYTAALISAIPEIDPDRPLMRDVISGEPPSPLAPPAGCAFHPRCAFAEARCREGSPPAVRRDGDRAWACILEPGRIQHES
jgi:peptide/nickel transport system ATP-binding protein